MDIPNLQALTNEATKKINRLAYAVIVTKEGHSIGMSERDLPGYWPLPKYGIYNTYDEAAVVANQLNTQRGLTAEEAAEIVASSMAAQNKRDRDSRNRR